MCDRSWTIAAGMATLLAVIAPALPGQALHRTNDAIRNETRWEIDKSRIASGVLMSAIGEIDYADTVLDSIGSVTVRDTLLDFQKEGDSALDAGGAEERDSTIYRAHPLASVAIVFTAVSEPARTKLSSVDDVAFLCRDGTRFTETADDGEPYGVVVVEPTLEELKHLARGPARGELGTLGFKFSAAQTHALAQLVTVLSLPGS